MNGTLIKNKWGVIILTSIIALCVAAGFYISTHIERYEEYVFKGWSNDALRNPFLAAEKILSKDIAKVESSFDLSVLDSLQSDATLIISNANYVLNERRVETVMEWLKAGGHVIVQAQLLDDDETDVLLSLFDVTKYEVEEPRAENFESFRDFSNQYRPADEEADRNRDDQDEDDKSTSDGEVDEEHEKSISQKMRESFEEQERLRKRAELEKATLQKYRDVDDILRALESRLIDENSTFLSFSGDDYEVRVDFSNSGSLDHPFLYVDEEDEDDYQGYAPFYWDGNENTTGFLQFYVGDGMLTVMSDMNVWRSDQIGFYDHAYLLKILTEESGQVVFLVGANVPNLVQLLWKHFTELCVALLLLVALWVIYRMRRFGVTVSFDRSVRRSFKEHLDAMSNYYWQQGLGEQLITGLRRDIVRILHRQYFINNRADDAFSAEKTTAAKTAGEKNLLEKTSTEKRMQTELQQKLMEETGITEAEATQALSGEVPTDEVKFYHLVKLLQNIRNHL